MSRSSGGWKSEIQVTEGSVPVGEGGLSSCLPMATFSPSPHMTETEERWLLCLLIRGPVPSEGPAFMTSCKPHPRGSILNVLSLGNCRNIQSTAGP